ncbi:hypothetical protein F5888DRAFT_1250819 [Russula emetica]|nr:hypothetical protein F5888DRAFT_1250819 [Russula emetica]
MSHAQPSQSNTPSVVERFQYAQARRTFLGRRETLWSVRDKDAARSWAQSYGPDLVRSCFLGTVLKALSLCSLALAIWAHQAGIDVSLDRDVCALNNAARVVLIPFATSEWLELAPGIVDNLKSVLQALSPGQSLGEAFPEVVAELLQAEDAVLMLPAPPSSKPSTSTLPPLLRMPSY